MRHVSDPVSGETSPAATGRGLPGDAQPAEARCRGDTRRVGDTAGL